MYPGSLKPTLVSSALALSFLQFGCYDTSNDNGSSHQLPEAIQTSGDDIKANDLTRASNRFNTQCVETINLNQELDSNWEQLCLSDNRQGYYDPYGPTTQYLAKYFTFTLEQDTDIAIELNNHEWNANFYLLEGERGGKILLQSSNDTELFLSAGTYTIEMTNDYQSDFALQVKALDQDTSPCVAEINNGDMINGAFSFNCLSENRTNDYYDPYGPQNPAFRARYFTFELESTADIRAKVDTDVSTYIYLLEGEGQLGDVQQTIYGDTLLASLPAGVYTLELTTEFDNAIGAFNLAFEILNGSDSCTKSLRMNGTISADFSPNCLMSDQYGGKVSGIIDDPYINNDGPLRANYHTFSLDSLADLKLNFSSSDMYAIISVYETDGSLVSIERPSYSSIYSSSADQNLDLTLSSGDYIVEIIPYSRRKVGRYNLTINALAGSSCTNSIALGEQQDGLLNSRCLSSLPKLLNRYSGMYDPYAPRADSHAKRFEFELSEPTNIQLSELLYTIESHLLLVKKDAEGDVLLNIGKSEYIDGRSAVQIVRHLDKGTYIGEVSSASRFRIPDFRMSLEQSNAPVCESFANVGDEARIRINDNESCLSTQQESQYYYDPYANFARHAEQYFARYNTFKVETTGKYKISVDSALGLNFYILGGTNRGAALLHSVVEGKTTTVELAAGYYTVETTTKSINESGEFSLLIEKINN